MIEKVIDSMNLPGYPSSYNNDTSGWQPVALSLFSGAGGMDMGVSQAGFRILASIEIDHNACETLRHWLLSAGHSTQVVESDIRSIDPAELMGNLGLRAGNLDLLVGGPPCQAFSQIGRRGSLDDERGLLLFEMIRFAKVFRPKAILLEQVKGVLNAPDLDGNIGGVFRLFINQLEELGYEVKWKVLNAADYGVPQIRHRVFIIGMLPPNIFHFPDATHCKAPNLAEMFPLPPYTTVGEVLSALSTPTTPNEIIWDACHVDVTPPADRRRIHEVPEGSYLAAQLHLPIELLGKLTKKDTTKFRRLSRMEPSLTLRCGEMFYHPIEDRYLTPRECLLLHGYPAGFHLKAPVRSRSGQARVLDQHRLVANSVPPPVARKLSESLMQVP